MNAFNKAPTEKEEINYNLPAGLTGAKVVAISYLGDVEKDYGNGPKTKNLYELIFATHKQNEFGEHYTISVEVEATLSKFGAANLTTLSKIVKASKWAFGTESILSDLLGKRTGLQIIEAVGKVSGKPYPKIDSYLDFDDTKGYEETGKIVLPPWFSDKTRCKDMLCLDNVFVKVKDQEEPTKLADIYAPLPY